MHILLRTEPLWLLNPPKLVYPEDPVLRRKQSNKAYAVKCQEDFCDLYIKETKQPPAKQMAQRRRTNSPGQDLAVYLYLQATLSITRMYRSCTGRNAGLSRESRRQTENNHVWTKRRAHEGTSKSFPNSLWAVPVAIGHDILVIKDHETDLVISEWCWFQWSSKCTVYEVGEKRPMSDKTCSTESVTSRWTESTFWDSLLTIYLQHNL